MTTKPNIIHHIVGREYGKAPISRRIRIPFGEEAVNRPMVPTIIDVSPGEDGATVWSTFNIAYSKKGKWIATSHGDHSIRIWSAMPLKQRKYLKVHKRSVWTMSFCPEDDDILVSGSLGGEIIVWDLKSNTHQRHQMDKPLAINSAAFYPHAAVVFFTQGNSIFYWEYTRADCGIEEFASTAHVEENIRWIHFDPDGEYLFTGILNNLNADADMERSFHSASQRNWGGLTQQEELETIALLPPAHTQTDSQSAEPCGSSTSQVPQSHESQSAEPCGSRTSQVPESHRSQGAKPCGSSTSQVPHSHESQSAAPCGSRTSQVPQGLLAQDDTEIHAAGVGRAAEARLDRKGKRPMEKKPTDERPFRVEALPQEPPAAVQREEGSKLPYEDFGAAGGEPEQPGQGVPEPSATPPPPTETDPFQSLAQALERKVNAFYRERGIELDPSVSRHLQEMSAGQHGGGNAPPPSVQEPQPSTSWAQGDEEQPHTSSLCSSGNGDWQQHLPAALGAPGQMAPNAQVAGRQNSSNGLDVNKCNSLIGGLLIGDQPPSESPSKEFFPSVQLRGSNSAGSNSGPQPADNQDSTIQGAPPEPSATWTSTSQSLQDQGHLINPVPPLGPGPSGFQRWRQFRAAQGIRGLARVITMSMNRETHCIQRWPLQQHLQITDRTANVVVSKCKLYIGSNINMSEDGEMLAVLQICGIELRLSVVSLATPTLGQVLWTTEHGPNAVSLNLSPGKVFLLVGLHSPGSQGSEEERRDACKLYRLEKKAEGNSMRLERIIHHPREFSNRPSVNATSFLPNTYDGILVGYNHSQLVLHTPQYPAPARGATEEQDSEMVKRQILY